MVKRTLLLVPVLFLASCTAIPRAGLAGIAGGAGLIGGYLGAKLLPAPAPITIPPLPVASPKEVQPVVHPASVKPATLPPLPVQSPKPTGAILPVPPEPNI